MLHIQNASKKFGNNQVLHNVNIMVDPGAIIGLAGHSGSGKSTLLRCIQRLEKLDAGEITLNGKSGFMFQDFQLFPHMTVLNNLTYAPRLHDKSTDHEAHAQQLLSQLGLSDKTDAYPQKLSGGQKQRVALARNLMMKPNLLLCDEPTSGLDMASIADVVNLLKDVQEMGVTMVIASHNLEFLAAIADRLVILKGGELLADICAHELTDPTKFIKHYYQEYSNEKIN